MMRQNQHVIGKRSERGLGSDRRKNVLSWLTIYVPLSGAKNTEHSASTSHLDLSLRHSRLPKLKVVAGTLFLSYLDLRCSVYLAPRILSLAMRWKVAISDYFTRN